MTELRKIRVVLVDDHHIVRQGMRVFLHALPDMELVGEANNGLAAIQVCAETKPDLLLIDMFMPEMDGIEAIKRIKHANAAIQIIVLSSYQSEETVLGALQAGATGYLLKNASFEEMEQAIRATLNGRRTLSPEVADVLIQATTRAPHIHFDLTRRELDVMALMIQGLSNLDIAERLTVSLSTVKFHVSSILTKLGASSRTEAVAIAVENHLVS